MIDTEKIPEEIFYKDKYGIDHFWDENTFPKKEKRKEKGKEKEYISSRKS